MSFVRPDLFLFLDVAAYTSRPLGTEMGVKEGSFIGRLLLIKLESQVEAELT